MKKILSLLASFVITMSFSQVGIGTSNPNPNAILDLSATNKSLLLPRVVDVDAIPSPTNGMVVYDITAKCARYFQDNDWAPCTTNPLINGSVSANCNTSTFAGTYIQGIAMTASNMFSVTITNNTSSAATLTFQSSDLVLSGVSGITVSAVSIPSVTLNPGQSQSVEYTLSGTPTANGTLTGTWAAGALNCVQTVVVKSPGIATLNCAGATNNGTLTLGTPASGVSTVVGYTGGNGSAYSAQTVASTVVTGLTATLAAGNFATGSGSLTYTITGTPSGTGAASFAITVDGQKCTFTRTIASPITIPSSITLAQNRTYTFASIFDQDYLPYAPSTGAATTNTQAADGSNESVTVNVQGSITTAGVTVKIPVIATGSNTLPAYSTTITIPANLTEDGISRNLTLSWTAQAYTSATTSINATIKAVGGTLNAKKLDINAGIGNDALGILMGQFKYPYNNAGYVTNYNVRFTSGIPDRMYGLPDNNGNSTTHMMLYIPITGEDGKVWLNNNLGAHYTNVNHPSFNITKQATSETDHLAYGSKFQWGRKPDGHELMTYTSSTAATPVYGSTLTQNNNPTDALFIATIAESNLDWRLTQNGALWETESSSNNPCPVGFRVPADPEFDNMLGSANITNGSTASGSALKLTFTGFRDYTSAFSSLSTSGVYWTSSKSQISSNAAPNSMIYGLNNGVITTTAQYRAGAASIRCIKD